jgi:hypothetical protein
VEIDDDGVRDFAERTGGKFAFHRREGIVERIHEDAAHRVDDENPLALRVLEEPRAASGGACGEVHRPDEPRLALDMDERLALVPGVIAERHHIDARIEEIVADRRRDAEAARRILAVHDHEIGAEIGAKARKVGNDGVARRAPHHIAEKKQLHVELVLAKPTRRRGRLVPSRSSRDADPCRLREAHRPPAPKRQGPRP